MEITELVRVFRLVFSAALGLALILSVAGLISHELRIVYEKLKRPMAKKIGLLATRPGTAGKHSEIDSEVTLHRTSANNPKTTDCDSHQRKNANTTPRTLDVRSRKWHAPS